MIRHIKIGNIIIPNNIFLAPMAGVTDLPFRLLCKENGCGLVYTEMVSAKGILYDNENTKKLLDTVDMERPIAVQLFGSEPGLLAKAAEKVSAMNIDVIDINMGCPAPKITKNGEGSALMKTPELIGEIVSAVSEATDKPITVKIRAGFDIQNINAVEVAKIAEKNGAKAITVHGRTRDQFYAGEVDLGIIKEVKSAVNIPVIGNGDIVSPQAAEKMFAVTGCDAIMIGRAACGNPWIFSDITGYFENGIVPPQVSIEEKLRTALIHAKNIVDYKGEYIGIRQARKHLAWYTKGIIGSAEIRKKINLAESLRDFEIIFSGIIDIHFAI